MHQTENHLPLAQPGQLGPGSVRSDRLATWFTTAEHRRGHVEPAAAQDGGTKITSWSVTTKTLNPVYENKTTLIPNSMD